MKDLIKKILKEDNDLEWINNVKPTSKGDISAELKSFEDFGYYVHNPEHSELVNTIHSLGLDNNQLDKMVKVLYEFGENAHETGKDRGVQDGWEEGSRQGWSDGYDEGQDDMQEKLDGAIDEAKEEGYDEGYEIGYEKGFENCEGELKEKLYNKAFEEGRAYESELDVEEYERRQSGFNPKEYDDDYEN